MHKRRHTLSIITALCVVMVYVPFAQSIEHAQAFTASTLSGLNKIAIRVDGISRDFEPYGLISDPILQRTREYLANNRLSVETFADSKQDPEVAVLHVRLNTNRNPYGFYSYGVSVEIIRRIALNNPQGGYISETVWTMGQTGVVVPTELSKINQIIDALVTKFLSDFHDQNPQVVSLEGS
ncbi:MAG: hypothetical protein O3C28_03895 [Proteobacteria bacterium]|nr:hypothetical protein [Pseudomonadota bacterium]